MCKFIKMFVIATLLAGLAGNALARDVKFEVSVDKPRIAIGEAAQLGLTFYETQGVPAPEITNIDGFEVRYLGPSTMMTVINGKMSSSITHMYRLLPLRTGKFQLGPFSFNYKGDTYTSNSAAMEVLEEKALIAEEEKAQEPSAAKLNLEDNIFVTLSAAKAIAYVNELIPITVKLYVHALNVSDIQLPTFGQEGFSKVEFKEPKQYRETLSGVIYDVLEFKTKIFGTRPGDYKLGPAGIKCNVMVKKQSPRMPRTREDFFGNDRFRDSFFDDFFTRVERYPLELKSQDIPLRISPLPNAGRPADFSGAIGDYQFIFNANPKKLKVGDPVTITMEINGTGNFNTVLIPKMEDAQGFKMYEPDVRTEENRKTFKMVMIPESEQVAETPRAIFNYFDPNAKQYKVITQGPIPIQVEKGKEEPPPQVVGPLISAPAETKEELKRDIIYIKEAPGRLTKKGTDIYKSRLFIILAGLPALSLLGFYVFQRRRLRIERDSIYAGRLMAMKIARNGIRVLRSQAKSKDPRAFYEALFKTMQEYLGNRLGVPTAGVTSDVIKNALSSKDVDPDILRKMRSLFDVCDEARFALSGSDMFKMHTDLRQFEDIVAYFEKRKI